jgi:hypothetical protein
MFARSDYPKVAFVTSSNVSAQYFHDLDEAALRHSKVTLAIVRGKDEGLTMVMRERIEDASLIIIGTCKELSRVENSNAQRLERQVYAFARRMRIRHALFSELLHEALLPHLAQARRTSAAIFVGEDHTLCRGGFLDMFPLHTRIVRARSTVEETQKAAEFEIVAQTIAALVR